jgi:DNA-binding Lrp family transcriptional regulator
MTEHVLTKEEQALMDKHRDKLQAFQKDLTLRWEALAEKLGCDVQTAMRIMAQLEHEEKPGTLYGQ